MFKWLQTFWRKKGGENAYTEAEKKILASVFTPMKPTEQFKAKLKEELLNRFAKVRPQVFPAKNLFIGAGMVVFGVLLFAIFLLSPSIKIPLLEKTLFTFPDISVVKAGGPPVPVNFPIRIHFPISDIPSEELQKHFSITPEAEGVVKLEEKILTFNHSKLLRYDTTYTIKISKAASGKLSEDFTFEFTTRKRFQGDFLSIGEGINFAHYPLNFYEEEPEVFLDLTSGTTTARIYPLRTEDLLAYLKDYKEHESGKQNISKLRKKLKLLKEVKFESSKGASLKPELKEPGMYFVELNKEDASFFLTYSRYAISTKRLGKDLITWLVDMKSGDGVPNAKIMAYNRDGKSIFEMLTDKNGIARRVVKLDISQSEKEIPTLLIADTGDEHVPHMLSVGYAKNIYGVDWSSPEKSEYHGYIQFDRPLYKPGDRVQSKVFLRKAQEKTYRGNIQHARVEVSRSQYGSPIEEIFKKDYSVGNFGTFAADFDLPGELKTGDYTMVVTVEGNEIIRKNFGVEVFQKPDFEVLVKPQKEKYVAGEDIIVDVEGKYFFGAPVKNQSVTVKLELPYEEGALPSVHGKLTNEGKFTGTLTIEPKKFPVYYFSGEFGAPLIISADVIEDTGKRASKSTAVTLFASEYTLKIEQPKNLWTIRPREKTNFLFRVKNNFIEGDLTGVPNTSLEAKLIKYRWEGTRKETVIDTWNLKTDTFGKAELAYEFASGGSYDLILRTNDSRGNIAEERAYLWIPDAEKGIFYDERLPETARAQVMLLPDKEKYAIGEKAKISAFAPQAEGDIFASINTTHIERAWTEKLSKHEHTFEVDITEDMAPGFYLFSEVYQGDSFFTGTRFIEVTGKKLSVEIMPSKSEFYPKETVTLSFVTKDESGNPVSSEGSISIVDKALLALRDPKEKTLFDSFYIQPSETWLATSFSVDPFSLGMAEKGGCFLSGTLILEASGSLKPIEQIVVGDSILTKESEFSSKLVPDRVIRTYKHVVQEYLVINGDIKVTGIHRLFVNGTWKTASEVRIGDFFIDPEGNRVTVQSLEKVVNRVPVYNFATERFHTYFANGIYVHNEKGGEDARPRTKFVDTAYWNAFVRTDAQGKAKVSFEIPDNLTTWVTLGKSITLDTKVGEGQKEFLVTKELFVRPNLPLFFRIGDEAEVLSSIHNGTNKALRVKASLKPLGFKILGEDFRELEVPANSIENIPWRIKIESGREAKFSFSVQQRDGRLVDNLEQIIPVYPALSLQSHTLTGVAPGTLAFPFKEDTSIFDTATLTLHASTVSILPDVIEKLTGYPYGCVEQTMSSHLPNVFVKKHSGLLGITPAKDLEKSLEEGFDRLQKFQHADGGFGWWEDDPTNIWMTGYVLEGLIEIKDEGLLKGREKMYDRTVDFLSREYSKYSGVERTYVMYVLSRARPGKFPIKFDEKALKEMTPQELGYTALTFHFNGDHSSAKKIVNDYLLPSMKDNHWEQPFFEKSYVHTVVMDKYSATGVSLFALLEIGGADDQTIRKVVQWLMNNRNGYEGLWGSTNQSSQILRALLRYIQKYDELNPSFTYKVMLNGKELASGNVSDKKFSRKVSIPRNRLDNHNSLKFSFDGKGSLFYTLSVKNYVSGEKLDRPNNGLSIRRTYTTLNGKPISSFHVGDTVLVTLEVQSSRPLLYVMVEDKLPAGFDVVNDRLEKREDLYGDYGYGYGYEGDFGWAWQDPIDIRDERITMFDPSIEGTTSRTFTYRARVARKGTFAVPAPRVEPMYEPDFYNLGEESVVEVK